MSGTEACRVAVRDGVFRTVEACQHSQAWQELAANPLQVFGGGLVKVLEVLLFTPGGWAVIILTALPLLLIFSIELARMQHVTSGRELITIEEARGKYARGEIGEERLEQILDELVETPEEDAVLTATEDVDEIESPTDSHVERETESRASAADDV